MKILILIQACDDAPYFEIQKAQEETWDSVEVNETKTLYYISGEKKLVGKKLYVPCSEAYNMMHWRFKLTLDYVWKYKFDYIFRTNASSYVDKKKLVDFINWLPTKGVYNGIDGGGFASGCGFIISRDVAEIIKNGLTEHPHGYEDVAIGELLQKNKIRVSNFCERFDYYPKREIKDVYHYRCKSDTDDRSKDIQAFREIHEFKLRQ